MLGSARLEPSPRRSGVVAAGSRPSPGCGIWGAPEGGGGGLGCCARHWGLVPSGASPRGGLHSGGSAAHGAWVARWPCRRCSGNAPSS